MKDVPGKYGNHFKFPLLFLYVLIYIMFDLFSVMPKLMVLTLKLLLFINNDHSCYYFFSTFTKKVFFINA